MNRIPTVSAHATLVFAMTALILYVPANFFPFVSLEIYGNKSTSTVWQGIVSLGNAGSWGVAIIVFLASIHSVR